MRAYVLQVVANLLLDAARRCESPSAAPADCRRLITFHRFVTEARFDRWRREEAGNHARPYERASIAVYDCAVGTANLVAEDHVEAGELPRRTANAIDWRGCTERWAANTGWSASVWAWWGETRTTPALASEPGPVYRAAANRLPQDAPETWALWQRFPSHLPPRAMRALTSGRMPIDSRYDAWLTDVLRALSTKRRGDLLERDMKRVFSRASRSFTATKNTMTVYSWAEQCEQIAQTDPHDPRVGEWTALTITRQVCESFVSNENDTAAFRLLNPNNVLVPRSWMDQTTEPLTWTAWGERLNCDPARLKRRELRIPDDRLGPSVGNVNTGNLRIDAVHSAASLLLGILAKDFSWPAAWNGLGLRRSWEALARRRLRHVPVSSMTTWILEQSLSTRARESALLHFYMPDDLDASDDDMRPHIHDVAALIDALAWACTQLRQHQLSVGHGAPRQLIPVSLPTLSEGIWPEHAAEMSDDDGH